MIKKFLLLSLVAFSTIGASDKVYIDEDEFKSGEDAFYIHTGHNIWIHTNCVHRDETGMYTYECNLSRSLTQGPNCAYEKKWRCPYCHTYWPVGKACQNADCPSKYKMKR